MRARRRWNLHICSPWSGDCHMRGIRLNVRVPHWFIIIGLFGGQVANADGTTRWLDIERSEM